MGLMGIPTADEMASMMGYVTDEDRSKWEAKKARSDAEMQRRGQVGQSVTGPALGMAEKTVHAQMQGEMIAERERQRQSNEVEDEVQTTTTTTHTSRKKSFRPRFDDDSPKKSDDFQMGG